VRRIAAALLAAAAFLGVATAVEARDFVVQSSLGGPLPGVRVVAFDERHQVDLPIAAISDAAGRVSLDPPLGSRLRIEAWGYAFWSDLPSPAAGPAALIVPYRRQRIEVVIDGAGGTGPPGVPVPWIAETPAGQMTALRGLVPPAGVTEITLPDRPWRLRFLLGGGSAEVFVRDAASQRIRFAMQRVSLGFVDMGGGPAAGLDIDVLPVAADVIVAMWRSGPDGMVAGELVPAEYRMRWRLGERVLGEGPLLVGDKPVARRLRVELHPVELMVGSGEGGRLPESAELVVGGEGLQIRRPLGPSTTLVLPAGAFSAAVEAGGFAWSLAPFAVPSPAPVVRGIETALLSVQVVEANRGLPFGAVRVGAGPTPAAVAEDRWTDVEGRASFVTPAGPLFVAASWFGVTTAVAAEAPGDTVLRVALPMRRFEPPVEHAEAPLVYLERGDFAAWAAAMPGGGFELPLPAGEYAATLHDAGQRRLLVGTLRVTAAEPEAQPSWATAAKGTAVDERPRRLAWPQALGGTPPTVGRREGGRWQRLDLDTAGATPALADGTELRIPDGAHGRIVVVAGEVIEAGVGLLELQLPRAGRAKLFDADQNTRQIVVDCADGLCRSWLPEGRWQVFAPGTQLLPAPLAVKAGERTTATLQPL
jgi:hypothetical protein